MFVERMYVLFYFILDIRYGGAIGIFNIIICWNEVSVNVSINGYIFLHFVCMYIMYGTRLVVGCCF